MFVINIVLSAVAKYSKLSCWWCGDIITHTCYRKFLVLLRIMIHSESQSTRLSKWITNSTIKKVKWLSL